VQDLNVKRGAFGTFTVILLVSGCLVANAQTSGAPPSVIANVFECRTIDDTVKRLACYDTAVGRFEAAQKSGEVIAVTKKEVETIKRESFGFNIPSLPKFGKLFNKSKKAGAESGENAKQALSQDNIYTNVTLQIAKTRKFGYKKTMFYFKNGQIWKQTDNKTIKISKKKPPQTAVIKKGSFGTFRLRINGSGAAYNVVRVK